MKKSRRTTITMAMGLAALATIAQGKSKEVIDALGSIIAVEQVAMAMCPELAVNHSEHAKYLADINPEKAPAIGPRDNKDVDAAVGKHTQELQEDIKKLGVKDWCASSLEMFGGKDFPYPILELKPK